MVDSFRLLNYSVDKYENIDVNLHKAKKGDKEEQKKLIRKYLPLIKKISKENGDYNEDLMQELIKKLIEKALPTYDESKNISFITYFYYLANKEKSDYFSKESYRQHNSLNSQVDENNEFIDLIEGDKDLENDYVKKELYKVLNEIINNLKFKHEYMIKSYFGFEGMEEKTMEEIAEEIGVSQQYVSKEINKVLNYIKSRLKWKGLD
ncbi:MAG: sigma-70 family RNA polymerase sigma factor [bacterium]